MPLVSGGAQRASSVIRALVPVQRNASTVSETAAAGLAPSTRTRRVSYRRVLPALMLALVALVGNAPSASAAYVHDSYEVKFIDLINDYRQSRGLKRYYVDSAYSYWANWRSADQCKRRYFSHTIPATSSPYWPGGGNLDRYWDYRYLWAGRGVTRFGEIIAYNTYTTGWLLTLFRQFQRSSIHNYMLLSADYKYDRIGVGVYTCNGRHHVTVNFIQK